MIAIFKMKEVNNMENKLTLENIKEIFDFDSATGQLFWKIKPSKYANIKVGDATGSLGNDRYLRSQFCREKYLTHRLIFVWNHGRWPAEIDHINGVKTDNRIENLREVTHGENGKNRRLNKNNASGHIGVNWHKGKNKWQAQIAVDNKKIYLGAFSDLSDAIKARKAASLKYNFHPNHGSIVGRLNIKSHQHC